MKANFLTTWINGAPDLPPMVSDSGLQLCYVEDGERKGGFTCVSAACAKTVIVQVDASPETIAAMRADARYLLVDDLLNESKAINLAGQTAIKDWLMGQGYTLSAASKLNLANTKEAIISVYKLHKLTDEQYRSGGLR